MPTATLHTIAKKLQKGDVLTSKSGTKFTVTEVKQESRRTVVLFDEDREIDFDPYQSLTVQRK